MTDTKWTAGPWKPHATGLARSGKPEHEIHWSEYGECIAEIVHGKPEAQLIAAAPDLYEALDSILSHFTPEHLDCVSGTDCGSKARSALAKARGES